MKIRLDIDTISDALYDALLAAFREEAKKQGLDAFDLSLDEWEVTCEVEHKV